MLWFVLNEQPNVKDTMILSLKEGMIVTSRVTAMKVFGELLTTLTRPQDIKRQPLVDLVSEIKSGLVTLFGDSCAGSIRLKKWLERANNQSAEVFTRQSAISELRDFFPADIEMEEILFKRWNLNELDTKLRKGVSNWEHPENNKENSAPTRVARNVNPYQLSFSEQARRGEL